MLKPSGKNVGICFQHADMPAIVHFVNLEWTYPNFMEDSGERIMRPFPTHCQEVSIRFYLHTFEIQEKLQILVDKISISPTISPQAGL
jgi:hypothetical protein